MKKLSILRSFLLLTSLAVASPALAWQQDSPGSKTDQQSERDSRRMQVQVASGQKMKVEGLIMSRDNDTFIVRDLNGSDLTIRLAGNTKIEEKKSNPFRGAKRYSSAHVVRGLNVEVEGRGDGSGALLADKIKFTDDDRRLAYTVDSTVRPVEGRLGQAEDRLTRTEQNAERLSGQVEELSEVANLARGGAAAAQESADAAIEGVNRTNDRISSLDDFEVRSSQTINFRVGSAVLSEEAKAMLDSLAEQALREKGYAIEVRGFASSDGSENLNRRLSQRRAEVVVRYLAENHDIPLRRIIIPFGYGEALPVADNSTREGRIQNRRTEVKVLVSRGLTTPVNVNRPVSTNR